LRLLIKNILISSEPSNRPCSGAPLGHDLLLIGPDVLTCRGILNGGTHMFIFRHGSGSDLIISSMRSRGLQQRFRIERVLRAIMLERHLAVPPGPLHRITVDTAEASIQV